MLIRFLLGVLFATFPGIVSAQSVQRLKNPAPDGAQETYQLTDGRVLAQSYRHNGAFWILTPDENGSFVDGTWKQVASLASGYSPTDTASQVLSDGRVLIEGGEYNSGKFV